MKGTKQKILQASTKLFNQHGYSQVTIRMIALEIGMSSGNLNYHFKKREEILESLYFEMVLDFDQRIKALSEVSISFTQISNDIQSSMERMLKYKFIWTDLFHILKLNEKVRTHFVMVYPERISGNLFLFDQLQKMKFIRPENYQDEYKILAERMVNFGDTWIYTSAVYNQNIDLEFVESKVKEMISIIYPYLTTTGRQEFIKSFPNLFT